MSPNEVRIFFQTIFNRSGSDAAKKAIQSTATEAKKAGTESDKAAQTSEAAQRAIQQEANKTAERVGQVKQAFTGLTGGVEAASGSLSGLIKLFPSLAAMAGPVAILSVAIAGLVKLMTYLQEKALAAFSSLQKSQIDNIASSANRLTEAYKRQRDELQRIFDVRNRLNSASDENMTASRRLEDAQAETVYQSALSAAGTDETLKAELTAEYNLMKANLAVSREIEDSKRTVARIEEENILQLEKRRSLAAEYGEKEALVNRLLEMQKYNLSEMTRTAQAGRMGLGGEKKTQAYISATGDASAQLNEVLTSMEELRRQMNDIPVARGVNQLRIQREGINQAVSGETGVQAGMSYDSAQTGIAAARDKEALAALERLNEAATGMSPEFIRGLQKVVDNLNNQKRFTAAEIDRLTRDTRIQRQRSIGF